MNSIQSACAIIMIILACLHLASFMVSFHSITDDFFKSHRISLEYDRKETPSLVWLMSFPNSGTSFTTQMIRMFTNQYTATNYGEEHIGEYGLSVPLLEKDPKYESGPFLSAQGFSRTSSRNKKRSLGKLVLTKTHCGGRCSRCAPDEYMESVESFKTDCFTARRGYTHKNGTLAYEKLQYDSSLVRKSIHLIRDPFDNIVSRFHLTRKIQGKDNEEFRSHYTNDANGFRKWCNLMDHKFADIELEMFNSTIMNLFHQIPCHADFYRYIMWHNLAFEVVKSLGIPSLTIHYEDYAYDFDGMKAEVISFLETEEEVSSLEKKPFTAGKSYRQYFNSKELVAVKALMYELSSIETRREVRRYFSGVSGFIL